MYIGDASPFSYLAVSDNKIGGPIPADLTKITGLLTFDASNNKLTGTVPAAVTTAFVVGTNIDVYVPVPRRPLLSESSCFQC